MHAEARCKLRRVHGLSRGDQQLARHAADARAGRPVLAAFDEHDRSAGRLRRAVGGEASGAGTDDCDVDIHGQIDFFAASKYFCTSSALPISLPPMKTCGHVPAPETPRNVLEVMLPPSVISS